MYDRSNDLCTRRSVLRLTGTALGAGITAGVAGARKPKKVPPGLARKAAEAQRLAAAKGDFFSDWQNNSLGKRETFYMRTSDDPVQYTKAAHVYPVMDGSTELGYITVGAQRRMPPILEYSKASPPTNTDAKPGKPLYHGGTGYGIDAENGVYNLWNGRSHPVQSRRISEFAFDGAKARAAWDHLDGYAKKKEESSTTDYVPQAPSGSDSGYVYGVPCWTTHDDGGASSTSIGSGPDSWQEWDGCSPVAGSMIIAYHEGVYEWEDDEREAIIDRLHQTMNTGDGWLAGPYQTEPQHIDDGFNNYSAGSQSYNATSYYVTGTDLVTSEIDANRPFQLNMTNGDLAEDETSSYGNYGDHSVAVSGYVNGGSQLHLHDGWNDEPHRLNWGNWLTCSITTVETT